MKHILLVEDVERIRALLSEVLTDARYDVTEASTFAEGRALLERARFDLLVVNTSLPDGSGMQLADIAAGKGIPSLLITERPDEIPLLEQSGKPYLAKPFAPNALTERIAQIWQGTGCTC